jgi:hypothetical protein
MSTTDGDENAVKVASQGSKKILKHFSWQVLEGKRANVGLAVRRERARVSQGFHINRDVMVRVDSSQHCTNKSWRTPHWCGTRK